MMSVASVRNEKLKLETRNAGNLQSDDLKRFGSFRSLNKFEIPTKLKLDEVIKNDEMPPVPPKPSDEQQAEKKEKKRSKKSREDKENKRKTRKHKENGYHSEQDLTKVENKAESRPKNEEEDLIATLNRLNRRRRKAPEEANANEQKETQSISPSSNKINLNKEDSFIDFDIESKIKPKNELELDIPRQRENSIIKTKKAFEEPEAKNDDGNVSGDENEVKVEVDKSKLNTETINLVDDEFFKPIAKGNTLDWCLTPAPQGKTVNCIVTCRKGIFNEYYFYLENYNGEAFLLMKAHRRVTSAKSYYLIDIINYGENGSRTPSYINSARIVSNMSRHKFRLDANFNLSLNSELLFVNYKTHAGEPRKIIANASLCSGISTSSSKDKVTYVLRNRNPYFDFKRKKFVLNYNGRAQKSSKNNFQIVDETSPDDVLMQLGKVDTNYYNCDYGFPLCALQAFGFALSSLCR
jgi:tubby-related protein 1